MPSLIVKITPPQHADRHQTLADSLTRITASTLGKRAELTAVIIEELPAAQWHIGGSASLQPGAWLEISITAGSNSADEKARFVAAAWQTLSDHLAPHGPLAAASYVIVRELPAGDWGYGGQTQAARRGRKTDAAPTASTAKL